MVVLVLGGGRDGSSDIGGVVVIGSGSGDADGDGGGGDGGRNESFSRLRHDLSLLKLSEVLEHPSVKLPSFHFLSSFPSILFLPSFPSFLFPH